jgi:peptidoglycan/LPS O-acetylase OafA/YrhL
VSKRSTVLAAVTADVVAVIVFCAIGRRSHAEGVTLDGVAQTAWPFLTGTLVGWLVARGWQRPTAITPTGLIIWVCTVAIGMVLRKATAAGTAFSFVVVASLTTAILLLGWRAAAKVASRS